MMDHDEREQMSKETTFESIVRVRADFLLKVPYGSELSFDNVAELVPGFVKDFIQKAVVSQSEYWRDGYELVKFNVEPEVLEIRGLWTPVEESEAAE